jgi:hypothetical protein
MLEDILITLPLCSLKHGWEEPIGELRVGSRFDPSGGCPVKISFKMRERARSPSFNILAGNREPTAKS